MIERYSRKKEDSKVTRTGSSNTIKTRDPNNERKFYQLEDKSAKEKNDFGGKYVEGKNITEKLNG